jgi:hypothetical protein
MVEESAASRSATVADVRREIAVGAEQADRGELRPGAAVFQRIRTKSAKGRATKA